MNKADVAQDESMTHDAEGRILVFSAEGHPLQSI
jgi:hypothetical protein